MFITLEGGEGTGKSTLIQAIQVWLEKSGQSVLVTREPGGTTIADQIRALFKNTDPNEVMHKETELCLVSAARNQHVKEVIKPALDQGSWVLCDRFADSSRVYQGHLGRIDEGRVESIIEFTTAGYTPDVTLLLDCPAEVSMQRVQKRSADTDRFDSGSAELHNNIREGFLQLQRKFPERIFLLDASQASNLVAEEAIKILREKTS